MSISPPMESQSQRSARLSSISPPMDMSNADEFWASNALQDLDDVDGDNSGYEFEALHVLASSALSSSSAVRSGPAFKRPPARLPMKAPRADKFPLSARNVLANQRQREEIPEPNDVQINVTPPLNPFHNIDPSVPGVVATLKDFVRGKAASIPTVYIKLAKIGLDFVKKTTRKKEMTEAQRLDWLFSRFETATKEKSASLLSHAHFDWTLDVKNAVMPDDIKLPHSTDASFPAAVKVWSKPREELKAGHTAGFKVARYAAARVANKTANGRDKRQNDLFNSPVGRVMERTNHGNPGCIYVDFRKGPSKDGISLLAEAASLAKSALDDGEIEAAIGAPDGAASYEAIAAVLTSYGPVSGTDVAAASKSAVAALAIALAALECAKEAAGKRPWITVSETNKKRLLEFTRGAGDTDEEHACKLHKATDGGDPGLLFFYLLAKKLF